MVFPSNRTKLPMLTRNKWLSRCVLCSPGREKIPGTTMVLIHQGAVRVEPEPVTAIQEEGQRLTAGHCPPLASGTTRTRPLMDQATGGAATTPAQTPDAPSTPPHPENGSDWPLCQALDETRQLSEHRFTCSTLVRSSGYHVNVEENFTFGLISLYSTLILDTKWDCISFSQKRNSLIIYSPSCHLRCIWLSFLRYKNTQTNIFRKIINLCESIKCKWPNRNDRCVS